LLKSLAQRPDERYPRPLAFSSEYLRALMGFATVSEPPVPAGSVSLVPTSGEAPTNALNRETSTGKPGASKKGTPKAEKDKADAKEKKASGAQTNKRAAKGTDARKAEANKADSKQANAEGADTVVGTRFIASAPPSTTSPSTPPTRDDEAASDRVSGSPTFQDEEEDQPARALAQEARPQPKRFSTGNISWLGDTVTQDLRHDGILSERLDGYEERAAQIEMAQVVAKALIEEKHAVLEASTGGRSRRFCWPRFLLARIVEAVETDVVAHALDQGGIEVLHVFLHKGDVFVKQLLLQGFVSRADDRSSPGAHNRKQVSKRLARPRTGLHHSMFFFDERFSDHLRHFNLRRTLFVPVEPF
jgi:hypothetical protein